MASSATIDVYRTRTKVLSGCKKFHNQGYKGSSITVCVIDSGVNQHNEFGDRLLIDKCKNFCKVSSVKTNIYDETNSGHGTHVASLIAGKDCGIAPEAKIISYKVINGEGWTTSDVIIDALNYIYTEGYKYIDIVNMSLGSEGTSDPYVMTGSYEIAINKVVNERGIPVIVASGNSGKEQYYYPAAFKEVIAVGAVDFNRKIALFSTSSNEVDLAQIGVDVWGANFTGGYTQKSGTSMATPYVCGIGALILDKYKKMFNKKMSEPAFYEMLKMSSVDIAGVGIDKNTGAGFCTLGDGVVATFQTDSNQRIVNGIQETMDAKVTVIGERNFAPARHVAEPLNAEVFWTSANPKFFEVIS